HGRDQLAVLRVLRRIEADRRQLVGVALGGNDELLRREALRVLEDLVDVRAASGDPMATVLRSPEDVGNAGGVESLQASVIVICLDFNVVEIKLMYQRGRDMLGSTVWNGMAHGSDLSNRFELGQALTALVRVVLRAGFAVESVIGSATSSKPRRNRR